MFRRRTIMYRQTLWRFGVLPAVIIAALAAIVILRHNGAGANSLFVLAVPAVAASGVLVWMQIAAGRRLAALIEADWRRCPYCFFDLRGLSDHGRCPECGEPYIIREVREQWKDAMAEDPQDDDD